MKQRKLNYRFHDPNPAAAADYILKVFMEVNAGKVEQAIREAANELSDADERRDPRKERPA